MMAGNDPDRQKYQKRISEKLNQGGALGIDT
jgi:hypothetical protein